MSRPAVPTGAGMLPAEQVVVRLRRHGRILIVPVLVLIATVGFATYGALAATELWLRIVIVSGAALVVLLVCVLPVLGWLTQRTTITTRRIIRRSGVFVRVQQELLHSRGYDVTVRRSWAQSAWGSGDVRINTGHERPVVLHDVPKPLLVQSALHELMAASRSIVADRRRAEQSAGTTEAIDQSRR